MYNIWPYQNLYSITENELPYFKTMEHRLCKWKTKKQENAVKDFLNNSYMQVQRTPDNRDGDS